MAETVPYLIEDAGRRHLREIETRLRKDDRLELAEAEITPRRALLKSWRGSIVRRAAYVDGEIAAVWGVGGSLLGTVGTPWLLTTDAVERASVAFVREARQEVHDMLSLFPILTNYVPVSYGKAIRFLRLLGFAIGEPEPFGKKGALFCRFLMQRA